MAYKVEFAGNILGDYCTVLNVKRSILPDRKNNSKSIPVMNGSHYTGFTYGERVIELEVFLKGNSKEDYVKSVRELARVLHTDNPSKLIVGDEPDKYVYAVLDGSTDLTKSINTGSATISFICHNPVIYSDKWNTFTPNNRNIIAMDNTGTLEADPFIDVHFRNKSCFFQATNRQGETVLIGTPKEIGKPTTAISDIVVEDDCTKVSSFTTLSPSLLQDNRVVNGGTYGAGYAGTNINGIVTTNFGTGETNWHGSAFRKSLGQNVGEFEVTVDFVFSSQGKNYEIPKPQPTPPSAPPATGSTCLGTYKVVNCGGLWVNREANTSNPLYAMAPGTLIYPIEVSGNWVKHVHSNKWNTYTGWSSLKYLQKVSDSGKARVASIDTRAGEYAEEQLGMIEVYGFDNAGAKLFRAEIADGSKWFENAQPKFHIGSEKVLEDNVITPSIRTQTNGEGQVENLASGAIGNWNDCTGKIVVKREKNSNGQYLWNFTLNKYVNGSLVKTLQTTNSLISSSYPKGDLNYLGFFIGGYGANETVSRMAITNVKVKKLNLVTDVSIKNNLSLFEENDHLQIDFENAKVLLNGVDIATQLDIGSTFFDAPVGSSDIIVRSDDEEMIACCGIREKFL